MTTFIIGSRKHPIFPKIKPDNVIYINGSFLSTHKNQFREAKQSIVLSPHIFVKNYSDLTKYKKNINIDMFLKIRKILKKNIFANIFIRPTSDKQYFEFDYADINAEFLKIFTKKEFDNFILNCFLSKNFLSKLIYFSKMFFIEPINITKFLLGIIKIRMMKDFKISTGILALMIAINESKFKPPYYVIGIGLDNSGYSYNNNNKINDRKNHLKADLNYINLLKKQKKFKKEIFFTNKKLSDYFKNK